MQNEYENEAYQQFAALGMSLNYVQPPPAYHTHPIASTSQQMYQQQPIPSPSASDLVHRRKRSNSRRKSPEEHLSLDAPTQSRRFTGSAAAAAASIPPLYRRQSYGTKNSEDEEDELAEEPPAANASEKEKAEWKRRQNTLAARRSRKRKMLQMMALEKQVEELTKEKEIWKTRALTLKQMLISHGILNVNFKDDE